MNAIIVDDEIHSANVLRTDLSTYCPQVKIIKQFDDSRLAQTWIKANTIDLVFLDIMMPHLTGIQLLESLQPIHFHVIFTTAYNQYATKAFRLSAVDFLEKPVDSVELTQAIQKVGSLMDLHIMEEQINTLRHNLDHLQTHRRVALPCNKGFEFVALDDINYLESEGNFTWVYFSSGKKVLVTKLLKQMELILDFPSFCRIHNKYFINLNHLKRFERSDGGTVFMDDDTELGVSRERKAELMAKMGIG